MHKLRRSRLETPGPCVTGRRRLWQAMSQAPSRALVSPEPAPAAPCLRNTP